MELQISVLENTVENSFHKQRESAVGGFLSLGFKICETAFVSIRVESFLNASALFVVFSSGHKSLVTSRKVHEMAQNPWPVS